MPILPNALSPFSVSRRVSGFADSACLMWIYRSSLFHKRSCQPIPAPSCLSLIHDSMSRFALSILTVLYSPSTHTEHKHESSTWPPCTTAGRKHEEIAEIHKFISRHTSAFALQRCLSAGTLHRERTPDTHTQEMWRTDTQIAPR